MFKKTLLALAVAAAATPAMAAIDAAPSGNGELFLAVSNWQAAEASRVTYVFDTGIKMADFLPGSAAATTEFTTALPGWSTFLSTLSTAGGNVADLRFSLFAIDGVGTLSASNPSAYRLLTTSTVNAAGVVAPGDGITESLQNVDMRDLTSGSSKLSSFLNATNALSTHSTDANGWSVNVRGGAVDSGDFSNAFLDSLGFEGSQINFTTGAALNSTIGFLYAADSKIAGTGYGNRVANVIDYADATFSVLTNGTDASLVYAIPEPGEIAFMLSGLGLAGLVARRRAARRA